MDIETLFAFLGRDDDGTEGLVGYLGPLGWVPLVGADLEKARQLEAKAQEMANATGKTISVVHFTQRKLVKTIEPNRLSPEAGTGVRVGGADSSIVGIP